MHAEREREIQDLKNKRWKGQEKWINSKSNKKKKKKKKEKNEKENFKQIEKNKEIKS